MRDVTNLYCWLATIPAPKLNSYGVSAEPETDTYAGFDLLNISVEELHLSLKCVQCSGVEFERLSELLSSKDRRNSSTALAQKAMNAATDILSGDIFQDELNRILNESGKNVHIVQITWRLQ